MSKLSTQATSPVMAGDRMKQTAYKGFNLNSNNELVCRDMVFRVGEIAAVDGALVLCRNGIHFCWNLNDIDEYYNLRNSVICEVEILGDIVNQEDMKKSCTNRLKVLRILTKEEVWKISNTGHDNTGYINTGDCNTGNWNTGDWNTGDWNSGFFNTQENKCYIFDKLSDMTVTEFYNSRYNKAIWSSPFILTEWVNYTNEEKQADKAKELIGGYLKRYDYKEACAKWWAEMSAENREIIKQLPNFDADKFFEITGIRV